MSDSGGTLEGYLMKRGSTLKTWQQRYFIFTPNGIKYAKKKGGSLKIVEISKTELSKSGEAIDDHGMYGFKLVCSDKERTLYAKSKQERDAWVSILHVSNAPKPDGYGDKSSVASPSVPHQSNEPVPKSNNTIAPPQGPSRPVSPARPDMPIHIRKVAKITDVYELGKTLGTGGFAEVKVCKAKGTTSDWAIKIIKREVYMKNKDAITLEIRIMQQLDHPNLVRLHDVLESDHELYIVMEWLRGDELFNSIVSKGSYSERDAAKVLYKLVSALAYLHRLGISHCDLKPENIVYLSREPESPIKLIDFGLSVFTDSVAGRKTLMLQGTPEYIAPETLQGLGYPTSVDMWSVGVIVYILLCGYYPFYGDDMKKIFMKVLKGHYDFPHAEWDKISDAAKNLIRHLLVLDPHKRYTAEQCLLDPWLKGIAANDTALPDITVQNLKALNARRKW
eukprot:CAMPEP_0184657086 /NCGR_PEP_ID=MMETSP0308-20130426/16967_1 /TAXON_ID=38269 /ORGANISM="Gloeochaete witrockiana, Strain SAG 46.84" /LENGTH=448 /DNA_ID=CAMNT_0027094489 /DNA_START=257 /DNA_END=1600 /DNA_ORIENTATION=+